MKGKKTCTCKKTTFFWVKLTMFTNVSAQEQENSTWIIERFLNHKQKVAKKDLSVRNICPTFYIEIFTTYSRDHKKISKVLHSNQIFRRKSINFVISLHFFWHIWSNIYVSFKPEFPGKFEFLAIFLQNWLKTTNWYENWCSKEPLKLSINSD